MDVLIVGDTNTDYLGRVDRFPGPDEEVEVEALQGYLGGSGANAAVVAARLGLEVAFTSAVGQDAGGSALLEQMAAAGISTGGIRRVAGQPSGMVFGVILPGGERRLFSSRGANLALAPIDIPDTALQAAGRLHLNGPEYRLALDLLERARRFGVPSSLDPGSILIEAHGQEMDPLLALTDVLFVNQAEFAALSRQAGDLERAADLHRRGASWVVQKRGSAGCTLYRPGFPPLAAPAYRIQAVDSTGSGDAFNAGFLYGLIHHFSLTDLLAFSNAVGAIGALAVGATSSAPASVKEVMDFIRTTPLTAGETAAGR
jgi:ribokinase